MMMLMRLRNSSTNEGDTLSRVVATSCTPPSCTTTQRCVSGDAHCRLSAGPPARVPGWPTLCTNWFDGGTAVRILHHATVSALAAGRTASAPRTSTAPSGTLVLLKACEMSNARIGLLLASIPSLAPEATAAWLLHVGERAPSLTTLISTRWAVHNCCVRLPGGLLQGAQHQSFNAGAAAVCTLMLRYETPSTINTGGASSPAL